MKKSVLILFAILLAGVQFSRAQEQHNGSGKVTIYQDEKMVKLSDLYKEVNQRDPSFDGFRVQIFFDSGNNSKNRATEALETFQEKYSEIKAYLSFKQPYYRIRVGNFRTRSEAIGFQKRIQADYPNAFTVKDRILFSEQD